MTDPAAQSAGHVGCQGASGTSPFVEGPPTSCTAFDETEPVAHELDERDVVLRAAEAVALVRRTQAYRAAPHPYAVEKQLRKLEADLREISDCLHESSFFWRPGRDEPMAHLLQLPLLQLSASDCVLVPVTSGHVKETWMQGELAVARFLLSGTDPKVSRYREYSSGILDAMQRDRLLRCITRLFWPVWDMPLTWGDDDDCFGVPQSTAHSVSAFGVAMRTQWEGEGGQMNFPAFKL